MHIKTHPPTINNPRDMSIFRFGDFARLLLPWLDPPSRHAFGLSCRSWWRAYIETCGRPGGPLTVVTRDSERAMVTGNNHGYGVYPRRTAIVYASTTPSRELCRCEMASDGRALVYGEGGRENVLYKARPVENLFRDLDDIPHYRYELNKIYPPNWTWGLPVYPTVRADMLDDLMRDYRRRHIHPYMLYELCRLMGVRDEDMGAAYENWRPLPRKRVVKRRRLR